VDHLVSLEEERVLVVRRWSGQTEAFAVFNFNDRDVRPLENIPHGVWRKRLDSEDTRWMGKGSSVPDLIDSREGRPIVLWPESVLLFEKETED